MVACKGKVREVHKPGSQERSEDLSGVTVHRVLRLTAEVRASPSTLVEHAGKRREWALRLASGAQTTRRLSSAAVILRKHPPAKGRVARSD